MSQLRYLFVRCSYFFITLELRYILVRSSYVWIWRYNYVSILFIIVTYFSLRHNYVTYFFDLVTFFDDVKVTFYFATFEIPTEITLQLRFVFVRHCDIIFITLHLRYLFVRCSDVFR